MAGGANVGLQALHADLECTRVTFHRLIENASVEQLQRPSQGTRWTNEQLLFHMLFGFMIVRALLVVVRIMGRLPERFQRAFATVLDAATRPFDVVNYWGACGGARVFTPRRMRRTLDRVIETLHRHLDAESGDDLARGMFYPRRWDPFFQEYMTLADIYRYPTQHFDFHRRQLTLDQA
jgi:hypothetical protein